MAFVAASAALGLQLTPGGAAFSMVLELGARGVLEGPVGVRCGSLFLEDRSRGHFGPEALLFGPARGSYLNQGACHCAARRGGRRQSRILCK